MRFPTHTVLPRAALATLCLWASSGIALAQGSLTTTDGLRLSLSSTGTVSSFQLNGTERASSGLASGFFYRELPPTAPGSDPFAGRVPTKIGTAVSSDAGGLTLTGGASGLTLSARFTSVGSAIKVEATLSDTTGNDRPIELRFRLPLNVPGWKWEQDALTSVTIVSGSRYQNLNTAFGSQGFSTYPFATVRNSTAAISLALPMIPQMSRLSYHTSEGLNVAWDLGLSAAATKTRSKAKVTFWIYSSVPKWGFRAAAEKYYGLNPSSFTSQSTIQGSWALAAEDTMRAVPNSQDFGWGFLLMGDSLSEDRGLARFHYIDPVGWFRGFPAYEGSTRPPPYSVLINTLLSDVATGTRTTVDGTPIKEMAQATINSSPYNAAGLYQVHEKPKFWYSKKMQIYPVSPDPDIPAPSMWSVIKKYRVDTKLDSHYDGVFLDDISMSFGNVENHRRSLWAYSDVPLSFSYASRKVMLWDGFSIGEFIKGVGGYLRSNGLVLFGSTTPTSYAWFAASMDMHGGETGDGAEKLDGAYMRRFLGYNKPWSNLLTSGTTAAASGATVLKYLQQALLLGYFPGAAGEYWNSAGAYERDRSLWKKYIPLIKKVALAGWKPIPYAVPSDSDVLVERFDNQTSNVFYLTAQNSGTSATTVQFTLDGAVLGLATGTITVKELVGNTSVSASRSGSNVLFSDTLAVGETTLYEVTQTGGTSPTLSLSPSPSPTPTPGPSPSPTPTTAVPSNGSLESGGSTPTGWTLNSSVTSGTWTIDSSTASSGTRSAKLAVSGSVDRVSPHLESVSFALLPGKTYTLTASTKTTGAGGTYSPKVYVVELDASNNVLRDPNGGTIQHGLSASRGTAGWSSKSKTFTTGSRCRRAFVYANIFKGYGTVWVDDVKVK